MGLSEGQEVTVTVESTIGTLLSPKSVEAFEALKRAAGGWAEHAEELDRYLDWNRRQRKGERREIPE